MPTETKKRNRLPRLNPLWARPVREDDLKTLERQAKQVDRLRLMQAARDGILYDPVMKQVVVYSVVY